MSQSNSAITSTLYMPWLAMVLALYLPALSAKSLHLESGVEQNTLIELYTSQGCSSCPPAERWLGKLQDDPQLWNRLIPIAFHVDYWDYIGWKDQFARPAFSQRQQRYHHERGIKSVYTPGFVVNGKEWRSWFGLRKLPVDENRVGRLTVDLDGNHLRASFKQPINDQQWMTLNVALIGVGITAEVTRGENSGRSLPQDFVVLEHITSRSENGSWLAE
ncbi:MAG: DUF1223 domain-containing protein, partial [Gammaproteobacteria bacterium]|nr:DUF1223 domain-containing protein [Gammaproteobacteria bacterium]